MKDKSMSLFENVELKEEIFEFLMAKRKIYKCHSCNKPAFESLPELESHMYSKKMKKERSISKDLGNEDLMNQKMIDNKIQKCEFTSI
jgi:hypothetical protein